MSEENKNTYEDGGRIYVMQETIEPIEDDPPLIVTEDIYLEGVNIE